MGLIKLLCTMALITLGSAATAQPSQFLPPQQAYRYEVSVAADRFLVSWTATPGYYLYRQRMGFDSATPAVTLGKAVFPKGTMHEDDSLGRQEIYRGRVTFEVPFQVTGARPSEVALKLKWQGCADAGLCYPPSTWQATVKLPPSVRFRAVKTPAELDRELAAAKKAGKPTLLDFTAEWCAPCKKMEKSTFPDPRVQRALSDFVLLRADVTAITAEDALLLKRFDAHGPPLIAFFDAQGREVKSCQLTGYVAAEKFRAHLGACLRA